MMGSSPLSKGSGWTLPGGRAALAVLGALLVSAVVYRLRLAQALGDPGGGWGGEPVPWLAMLRQLGADVMLAAGGAALVLALAQLGSLLPARGQTAARALGLGLVVLLLLAWGALCQSHQSTLLATGSGLTVELLRESLALAALREALLLLLPSELALLLLPLLAFALLLLLRQVRARQVAARSLLALAAGAALWALWAPAAALPESLLHHPVAFVVADAWRTHRAHAQPGPRLASVAPPTADPADAVDPAAPEAASSDEPPADAPSPIGAAQDLVLALPAPQFAHPDSERPIKKTLPPAAGARPYNILWVLMESTGLDYALKPTPGSDGKVAMPFLQSLTQKGYFLSNHFSAGNSSPRGIFSLLSGLYVMPEVAIFDVRKDVYLPSLGSYLGARYQRFLVTPASLDWYFPHSFLLHSGFGELWGYHALPVRKNAPGGRAHARDEAETVSFFLHRLDDFAPPGRDAPAPKPADPSSPFVAVYYSFIAHWPYPDYGESTHLLKPIRPLNNYYNNLHYLDQQIERIYEHLKQKNLLEDTILVFAGDHGEAFGQHQHNYTHSRASYNENYRTPALLLHPRLFPPRVFTAATSHVDILPTLLDALGLAYDPKRLQGESLYQDQFRRKYIFLYGNEDTVSSISEDLIKLQISFKNNACWAFDLKLDPEEKRHLPCLPYKEQQQALLLYRNNQRVALRRYNREAQARGTAGPTVAPSPPVPPVRHARN